MIMNVILRMYDMAKYAKIRATRPSQAGNYAIPFAIPRFKRHEPII